MANISSDLMYRALPYIYRNVSVDEFLGKFSVDEAIVEDFKVFWASVSKEVTEARAEDPNIVWDTPSEWP